ncbi:MAG: hypothetical protein M1825_005286 [Sarcosagium campestre]|nr:MAG: hypothetical protein M1825_005286 [Sarcosagium campestre]
MHSHYYTQPKWLPLWILRIVQLVFSIIVLGLAASDAADWKKSECSIPAKLSFNLAVAVLSILASLYLILSTGKSAFIPHHIFAQAPIDLILFVLWIAAAATAKISTKDGCKACFSDSYCNGDFLGGYDLFDFDSSDLFDSLDSSDLFSGKKLLRRKGGSSGGGGRSSSSSYSSSSSGLSSSLNSAKKAAKKAKQMQDARTAFDALLVILFFVTLIGTGFGIFQLFFRKGSKSSGASAAGTAPVTEEYKAQSIASSQPVQPLPENQQGAYYAPPGQQPVQQPEAPAQAPYFPPGATPEQHTQTPPPNQQTYQGV